MAFPGRRPYVRRPIPIRRPPLRPIVVPGAAAGSGAGGAAAIGGVLGALGGTLGCLLCLSAIAALGLFACVVALTAYARRFLDAYRTVEGLNAAHAQFQIGFTLLLASLFYIIVCRMQRC
ncbi:unnamed protein product [Rotaria sordida]|uniref:Uncharacterized protein n=1 Tax=Rotaria sordida TaxID=392033 RepID=A0A815GC45_9BILA|nr:unnamed protein product [Rotaria sordida]CAF1480756.1 unnamed protein product [Rotaria sordida]CAF3697861.1 unnamed protein product [Rotaria sordida]CAF3853062.1 unnamed protein product [Rotaria sordida]